MNLKKNTHIFDDYFEKNSRLGDFTFGDFVLENLFLENVVLEVLSLEIVVFRILINPFWLLCLSEFCVSESAFADWVQALLPRDFPPECFLSVSWSKSCGKCWIYIQNVYIFGDYVQGDLRFEDFTFVFECLEFVFGDCCLWVVIFGDFAILRFFTRRFTRFGDLSLRILCVR